MYGPYVIDAYSEPMSTQREIEEVISGRLINVIASDPGHPDLNAQTIPIAIPIDKGLLGYRVALIRRDQQTRINEVNDIQGLRLLNVGQGQDWGDVPVYRFNRIPWSRQATTISCSRCWFTAVSTCSARRA